MRQLALAVCGRISFRETINRNAPAADSAVLTAYNGSFEVERGVCNVETLIMS